MDYSQIILDIIACEAKPTNPTRLRNLCRKRIGPDMNYDKFFNTVDHLLAMGAIRRYQQGRGTHKCYWFSDQPAPGGWLPA